MVYVPVFVVELTVKVIVEVVKPLAGGVAGLLEKLAVTPLGSPEALRETGDWKSLIELTVRVTEPDVPLTMVIEDGLAESEKSGGVFTVRRMVRD